MVSVHREMLEAMRETLLRFIGVPASLPGEPRPDADEAPPAEPPFPDEPEEAAT